MLPEVIPIPVSNSATETPLQNARPLTRARTTLNLNTIFDQKPEVKKETANQEPANEIPPIFSSPAEIQQAWNSFAEAKKDQAAEYNLMQRPITIEGNNILITLTNQVDDMLFHAIRTALHLHLLDTLRNPAIHIESVLKESEIKKIAYTNKEKFDLLAEKNPLVLELKERLGLDSDY